MSLEVFGMGRLRRKPIVGDCVAVGASELIARDVAGKDRAGRPEDTPHGLNRIAAD